MKATKKQLNRIKELWFFYTKEKISDEKATDVLELLVKLFKPIYGKEK